jgi:glutaredoxin
MIKKATLYRMVTDSHICPFGLKAKDLLQRKGYRVDDHHLSTRAKTDAFKAEHNVETTPQIFIDGKRIGGYDALRRYFGLSSKNEGNNYLPLIYIFTTTLLLAIATGYLAKTFSLFSFMKYFISYSMCVLAILKLLDLSSFTNSFLGYDLLAQRYVPYAYAYPFLEISAGVLMFASVLMPVAIIIALFIGTVGAISVIKAVYIDKRELKCACVGGNSKVSLGFISLTENLMMIIMAMASIFHLANFRFF